MRDYWEPGDMIFVHMGKRYGLTAGCRTVCLGPVDESLDAAPDLPQPTPANSQPCYKLSEGDNYQGKVLPELVTDKVRMLANRGLSTRAIAKEAGVSNVTVFRIMQRPLMKVS